MSSRNPPESTGPDIRRARLEARIRRQYETVCEAYHFDGLTVQLTRVAEPDEMLERMEPGVASGAAAVPRWQPYWAELWGCSLAVCDILYDREDWPFLETFWRAHLALGGRVLLGEGGRSTGGEFPAWLDGRGWRLDRTEAETARHPRPFRLFQLCLDLPCHHPRTSSR
jgi:hypothetical protein